MSELDKKKRNWKLLVPIGDREMADVALQHAIGLSKIFEASLILVRCISDISEEQEAKSRLAKIVAHLKLSHGISADAYVPLGRIDQLLFPFAAKTEAILVVIGHNWKQTSLGFKLGKCLRFMRNSRTPFIMCPLRAAGNSYKSISISVSYHRQEKEKILWASYLGRINNSHINVLIPGAKDGYFATGIRSNLMVLKKLYNNLSLDYKLLIQKSNVHRIHEAAMEWSSDNRMGAYLMLTTTRLDIFDLIQGSAEKNACLHPSGIPVLCINPRDDLYVLCN